jgi:hypothetical protein
MCEKCLRAWAEYEKVVQPAWAEYYKVERLAWDKYEKVMRANHPAEARE